MKTLISISCLLVLLLSCNKKTYVYSIYNMEDCLQGENQEEVDHDVFTFDQGFFYYENCQGYKEIDGVKVNWLEDKDCPKWKGIENDQVNFLKNNREKVIDSLTNEMIVPQRFFLVFLDKKRVMYFTNYEASKYFKKRVKSIYKDLDVSQLEVDSLVKTTANVAKLDSILQAHFRVKGWSDSDFAFANYNLFTWGDSLLTFNQEIPLMERNWKKSMKGIYKTYKDSTGFYLKTAFDKGTLKIKESDEKTVGSKGLIELTFRSVNLNNPSLLDSAYHNLELVVMNIPDESVNLKSATRKDSRRRSLLVENIFAIKPIFSFHQESLKLTLEDGRKVSQMVVNKIGTNKFEEKWMIENESPKKEEIRKDKGWWEK
ncbi:MAG: hypothetical protein AB8F94_20600 [Saprospiraceae bacterium]